MLFRALRNGDQVLLAAVARLAVARFSAIEAGRPVGGTYYLYRTLRNLDLDGVLARLVAEARALAGDGDGPATATQDDDAPGGAVLRGRRPGRLTALEERLLEDEYRARIEELKKEIEAEIRRRLVADRGAEALRAQCAQAVARGRRVRARHSRGARSHAQGHPAAHEKARDAPRPQAPSPAQGSFGLPLDHAASLSYGGVPASLASSTPGRQGPRSGWSPTSRVRWRRSPASPCISSMRSRHRSRRCAASCSSTASTRWQRSSTVPEHVTEAVHPSTSRRTSSGWTGARTTGTRSPSSAAVGRRDRDRSQHLVARPRATTVTPRQAWVVRELATGREGVLAEPPATLSGGAATRYSSRGITRCYATSLRMWRPARAGGVA